ncbi:MAG: hypothetical protein GY909_13895 [Oligoflexia bacterium]|nr:hypothetical protein [Oligoflexia bacterium]
MTMQENLIKEFRDTFTRMTLNELTNLCDIERTRLFRIFNGYEMKISEYEKIKACLTTELGNESSLERVASDCVNSFKERECLKISDQLRRKMRWLELIHSSRKISEINRAA